MSPAPNSSLYQVPYGLYDLWWDIFELSSYGDAVVHGERDIRDFAISKYNRPKDR